MAFSIADNQTPSSIYAGFAAEIYKTEFITPFKNAVTNVKKLAASFIGGVNDVVSKVKKGIKFFGDWWKDDPVGATAGALAVGLSVGLVVTVAGAVSGPISGGIAALRSLSLVSKIKLGLKAVAASFSVGSLIRFMIRGVQHLWNFNWNIKDSEIRKQQDSLVTSLYGLTGSVIGTSLASVLCGTAPIEISKRTGIIKINPMTLAMIRDLTEFNPHSDEYGEIYEEMMEAMKALVSAGTRATAQILFLESYKNIRKWIKDTSKHAGLTAIFPKLGKTIEQWGSEGSQAWSFASATEEWIESIPDEKIKSLTEEAVESFMDTCTENAMVVSYLF